MGYNLSSVDCPIALLAQSSVLRMLSDRSCGTDLAIAVYAAGLANGKPVLLTDQYHSLKGADYIGQAILRQMECSLSDSPVPDAVRMVPFSDFRNKIAGRLMVMARAGYGIDRLDIGMNGNGHPVVTGGRFTMKSLRGGVSCPDIDDIVSVCRNAESVLWEPNFSQMTGDYLTEFQANDIHAYIGMVLPGSVYLDSGADGVIFRISDDLILKVYYDEFSAPDLEAGDHPRSMQEITAMRMLSDQDGIDLAPKVLASGRIGPFMCMVRRDLKDIESVLPGIDETNFLESIVSMVERNVRDGVDYRSMSDNDILEALKRTADEHEMELDRLIDMQIDPFLSVSFIRYVAGLFHACIALDITPVDVGRYDNFGHTAAGGVMLRDMSRFLVGVSEGGQDVLAQVVVLAHLDGQEARAFPGGFESDAVCRQLAVND